MSRRGPWSDSYKLLSFLELFYRYRSFSIYNISARQLPRVTVAKIGHGYSMLQGLHLIDSSDINGGTCRVKDDTNKASSPARAPLPAGTPAPAPPRARWVLGSILSLLMPFRKQKWEKLKKIEGETEMVIEEVEKATEVAEKLATDVADVFPDHTKLKEAALLIEHVSKETAHDARLALNFLRKQDLNGLETLVEPIVDKMEQYESKVTRKKCF